MIRENMQWPPLDNARYKMAEYSAWYSGDPTILANVYNQLLGVNPTGLPYSLNRELFWARQINNKSDVSLHVPIAGDIASLSADLLFSEPPIIKIAEAHQENAPQSYKDTQDEMDTLLSESGFYRKCLECAEACAAMGGGFIKLSWDNTLSQYPIPVVEQIDNAIPEFRFGILTQVTFWKVVKEDNNTVFRLFETYDSSGSIYYELYRGTQSNLGMKVDPNTIPEGQNFIDVSTNIGEILCAYVPNILPNRLDRTSCQGRSDYAGVEGMMDALDETYSAWMKDVAVAQGKILIPQQYLEKVDNDFKFNRDQMVYAKIDVDPVSNDGSITPVQFAIRAAEFETTCLNLLERIISAAGYSPQSIGLNISGRAESGTALNLRERKSFITKNKKQTYWTPAIKKLVTLMLVLYSQELGGKVETDVNLSVSFSDSLTSDLSETSTALQRISQAIAASTKTKVKMLHPDWSEDEVTAEVQAITEENNLVGTPPDGNLDPFQMR